MGYEIAGRKIGAKCTNWASLERQSGTGGRRRETDAISPSDFFAKNLIHLTLFYEHRSILVFPSNVGID